MGIVERIKSAFSSGKRKRDVIDWSLMRPTELSPWSKGVSDVAKMPTLPWLGFRFCYELYNYSDLLRTIIRSLVQETFRKGLTIVPKFAVKCAICGAEYQTRVAKCELCGSDKLREPDKKEFDTLRWWMEDVNFNDQSLVEVLKEIDYDLNIIDNAYLAVVKKYTFNENGEVIAAKPLEVLRASPEKMELVMDKSGRFARSDDGRVVMFCLVHRDRHHLVDEEKARDARCPICGRKMYPAYYRMKKKGRKMIYYTNGEILHVKKFTHGVGYGLPPIFSVWMKVMILMKQDFFILTAYHLERPPKGILVLRGSRESIEKSWRRLMEEAEKNPHIIYPLIVEGGRESPNRIVEWLDLSFTSKDVDFGAYRDEIRRTVGAMWGVMPIFTGDTVAGYGLANEGLQVLVTNRAIESEQRIFNDKVLPWLMKQLGVKDWQIQVIPSEGRDIVARIQREQMRIQNAMRMMEMGYRPIAVKTEDGIDFVYEEQEGEPVKPLAGRYRLPSYPRQLRRYEGEPEHGRPKVEEQRYEGEVTGVRRPKTPSVVGVVGEGGSIVPTTEQIEREVTSGDIKKEDVMWFAGIVDDDDFEVFKAGWKILREKYSKAVKSGLYGAGRRRRAFVELGGFWSKNFAGLDEKKTTDILNILFDEAVIDGNCDAVDLVRKIVEKTGISEQQAYTIVRTELANLANKARELAYREKTKVKKFIWKCMSDDKVCDVCRKIERATAKGVTLEELKRIIKRYGGKKAREYLPHPNCRCAIIAKRRRRYKWE